MGRYFEFNTGRSYTKQGQIIRCYREPSRAEDADPKTWDIWFYDVSRGVMGLLTGVPEEFADEFYVIGAYDFMNYQPAALSDRGIREIIRQYGTGEGED